MKRVVTIDGPAGAGKSTVARKLADRLGWRFLDTGAMYRAATLAALLAGVELTNDIALGALVSELKVRLPPGQVILGEQDVTAAIRAIDVTNNSHFLADSPSVRRQLTIWQREFASLADVVTEGRDQGTLVFPDAFRKYYLTASALERAQRRLAELQSRGESVTLESIRRAQDERDARDAARAIAPMKPAADAILIDTTGLSIDQVVAVMADDVEAAIRRAALVRD
jgi:cytidylate kinase